MRSSSERCSSSAERASRVTGSLMTGAHNMAAVRAQERTVRCKRRRKLARWARDRLAAGDGMARFTGVLSVAVAFVACSAPASLFSLDERGLPPRGGPLERTESAPSPPDDAVHPLAAPEAPPPPAPPPEMQPPAAGIEEAG